MKLKEKFTFLIYLLIISIGNIYHEPWRDEAQAWLIAQNMSWGNFIEIASYEGKPLFWHLLLVPFAQLGFPYWTQLVIHGLFAAGIAWLLLKYSPFSFLLKILLLFSFYGLFEYAIPAKSYVISMFLVVLLTYLQPQKLTRSILYGILVFLLMNTNIHSAGLALGFSLLFFKDHFKSQLFFSKRLFKFLIPITLGGFLLLWQVFPPEDSFYHEMQAFETSGVLLENLKSALFPGIYTFTPIIKSVAVLVLLGLMFFAFHIPMIGLFLLIQLLWLAFIFLNYHPGSLRHSGFIFFTSISVIWLLYQKGIQPPFLPLLRYMIILLLLPSLWQGFNNWWEVIQKPYSGSQEAARLIKNQGFRKKPLFSGTPGLIGQALLPYLPGKEVFNLYQERWETYKKWDTCYGETRNIKWPKILQRIDNVRDTIQKPFILISSQSRNLNRMDSQLVGRTTSTPIKTDEQYWIYLIKPD